MQSALLSQIQFDSVASFHLLFLPLELGLALLLALTAWRRGASAGRFDAAERRLWRRVLTVTIALSTLSGAVLLSHVATRLPHLAAQLDAVWLMGAGLAVVKSAAIAGLLRAENRSGARAERALSLVLAMAAAGSAGALVWLDAGLTDGFDPAVLAPRAMGLLLAAGLAAGLLLGALSAFRRSVGDTSHGVGVVLRVALRLFGLVAAGGLALNGLVLIAGLTVPLAALPALMALALAALALGAGPAPMRIERWSARGLQGFVAACLLLWALLPLAWLAPGGLLAGNAAGRTATADISAGLLLTAYLGLFALLIAGYLWALLRLARETSRDLRVHRALAGRWGPQTLLAAE